MKVMKSLSLSLVALAALAAPSHAGGPAMAALQSAAAGSPETSFDGARQRPALVAFGNAPSRRNADGVLVITAPKWIDSPKDGTQGGMAHRMERNCGGLKGCLDKASYTDAGSKTVSRAAFIGAPIGAVIAAAVTGKVVLGVLGLLAGAGLGILVGAAVYGAYQANKD